MSKKPRILLATHIAPAFHGQAMMAAQLAEVSEEWTDIELISLNTAYSETRSGLKGFSVCKVWKMLKYAFKARKLIRRHQISHVILCPAFFKGPFLKDAFLAHFLKWTSNVSLIGWVHMDPNRLDLENQSAWFKKVASSTLSQFSQWVACSPSLVKYWPDWLTDDGTVTAISNGIPEVPEEELVKEKTQELICNVVYLSAMDDEKGWRDLLQAAEVICKNNSNYRFNFYGGSGADLTEEILKKEFETLAHRDWIQWHGVVHGESKIAALQSATIFVFPSYTEQFPLSVLEAMSYGIPILSNLVGAVEDALCGEQIVSKSSDLAASIKEMFEDKNKMAGLSLRNKTKFKKNFSTAAFAENWHNYLLSLPN